MVREFSCPSRPVAVGHPAPAGPRPLMGRLRHGEFSHNFRYRAHQEMDETRAGFLPRVLRSPREKDVTDVTHEDGDAAHLGAGDQSG
jgi:hypothetical protein